MLWICDILFTNPNSQSHMTNFQDSSPDPDPDFSINTNKKLTKIFGLLLS